MMTGNQMKAARALLGITQTELAAAAGISVPTIKRMEVKDIDKSSLETVMKVRKALEAAGVVFIPENGGGAGVRLAKPSAG